MTDKVTDIYADPSEPEVDRVYYAYGSDWQQIIDDQLQHPDESIVINMGPQHPSTHGVLRLILEMDGETVTSMRPGLGFLHTGIEKNMEYRTWTQGVAYISRANYVAHVFNEAVYCLGVEKLLGVTDQIPERASIIRVMMMECNRLASHLTAAQSGGLELGASTVAEVALREREMVLEFFQAVTGLRMNFAFIRPGGVANDLPEDGVDKLKELIAWLDKHLPELGKFTLQNPIFKGRMQGVGYLDLSACMALGVTGPTLRATGYPWDLRKSQPYCGYENFEFEVPTHDGKDCYARWVIRLEDMQQSVRILKQCVPMLEATVGQPVMIEDPALAWPADLALGVDGQGNSHEHVKHIMGESMEGLIHHFKMIAEGFKVPAGQVYQAVENPSGELGIHIVSDGGSKPWRVHLRDPGFNHIQALPAMCEGSMLSDLVPAIASIDPVMGGVDR